MDEKYFLNNLSVISHEMQTPINLISATAQLINFQIENKLSSESEVIEYMDNIINNCNKISMMISNLTDLNTLSISKKEYVNSEEFFNVFCKNIAPYCKESDVKLKSIFECKKEYILISVNTTERILLNLITNAIKYNDKNNKKITLKMYNDENNIFFSVKDNGIGIAKENIEKITKRFFRVNNNYSKGFGIGLALVKESLDLMGGNINIKSQLKKGTEIIISIPSSDYDTFISGELNYVYRPEKSNFDIEFAQLKP